MTRRSTRSGSEAAAAAEPDALQLSLHRFDMLAHHLQWSVKRCMMRRPWQLVYVARGTHVLAACVGQLPTFLEC